MYRETQKKKMEKKNAYRNTGRWSSKQNIFEWSEVVEKDTSPSEPSNPLESISTCHALSTNYIKSQGLLYYNPLESSFCLFSGCRGLCG